MPDWSAFRAAMTAGSMPAEMCRACELVWSCLDLPSDAMRERIGASVTSDAEGTYVQRAMSLVRLRLFRDHGIDPADIARRTELVTAVAEGRASAADVKLSARIDAAGAIGQYTLTLFPAGVATPRDMDTEALDASTPALQAAILASGIGSLTAERFDALRAAIATFTGLGANYSEPAATNRAWWLGLAWWSYGRAASQLGRRRDARDAMEQAAAFYDRAGEAKDAAACRDEVLDIQTRFAADFDAAAAPEVSRLLEPQAPLERVKSLTRLVRNVGGTGDTFEANRVADEAAGILVRNGYADPEYAFDAAVDAWVATASQQCRDKAILARLAEVSHYWAEILGARTKARAASDPAGSARADRALRGLRPLAAELDRQAAQANREMAQRLEVWMPRVAEALAPAFAPDESAAKLQALDVLDDDLLRLRIACNEGASEAQVATALALRARANALGSRVHVARAILEHAYVLLALARHDEVPALADLALQALLAGQAPALSAFGSGYEREMYLTAIGCKARALAARGEHAAVLALLEPVIRDIESERARVSSPYQQSAFLATRAELYERAAAAAYRTGRLDDVLALGELLKARAALRSRLSAPVATGNDDLEARFRAINEAIARGAAGTPENDTLQAQRQWLLTARSIARARAAGAALPEISVAAIQGVLAADECAITWLWIGEDALVVLAIGREGTRDAVVKLTPAQQSQLRDYVASLSALSGSAPPDKTLPGRVSALVTELGAILLPATVRAFIAGKARLVLSPHRSLHLFPFHAAPWPGGFVVEHFAIRCVPNLTSLLMPWDGNGEGRVLAVGVGTFDDPNVAPLPHAEDEAAAVAAAHGERGQALLGATRAQFTALPLQDYRCLHLATHGSSVLTGHAIDDPMQSCLFLRDGALDGFELAALPVRAELVVLSACYSGQRAIAGRGLARLPGDDLFGLQGVLFETGVGALLGALWQVADEVAGPILTDFHRHYATGALPEDALQAALIAHLRDPGRPRGVFYWAPFFLSGLGGRRRPSSPARAPQADARPGSSPPGLPGGGPG